MVPIKASVSRAEMAMYRLRAVKAVTSSAACGIR